jgi:hemin uptake protein HemP
MAGWNGTGEGMISSDDSVKGTPSPAARPSRPRRIPVENLMQESTEVMLIHRGTEYRLRVTANGKLILTK